MEGPSPRRTSARRAAAAAASTTTTNGAPPSSSIANGPGPIKQGSVKKGKAPSRRNLVDGKEDVVNTAIEAPANGAEQTITTTATQANASSSASASNSDTVMQAEPVGVQATTVPKKRRPSAAAQGPNRSRVRKRHDGNDAQHRDEATGSFTTTNGNGVAATLDVVAKETLAPSSSTSASARVSRSSSCPSEDVNMRSLRFSSEELTDIEELERMNELLNVRKQEKTPAPAKKRTRKPEANKMKDEEEAAKEDVKMEDHPGAAGLDGPAVSKGKGKAKVAPKPKQRKYKGLALEPYEYPPRAHDSKYFIGAHVSISESVAYAPHRALVLGGKAFGLFTKNQKAWASKPLAEESIRLFHMRCSGRTETIPDEQGETSTIAHGDGHGFDSTKHIVPHGSYLTNLCNPDPEKRKKSYENFLDEMQRCEALGIGLFNIHPGSTTGGCTREESYFFIADCINEAHKVTKSVTVLLENMAHKNNCIGYKFEDLAAIIALVQDKSRIGVCFDTCHAFAAGYDLRSPEAFAKTFEDFDAIVGLGYLKAFHVNDSEKGLGEHRDLHQNIGAGQLGLGAFHNLMRDSRFHDLPMILETPMLSGSLQVTTTTTSKKKDSPSKTSKVAQSSREAEEQQPEGLNEDAAAAAAAAAADTAPPVKLENEEGHGSGHVGGEEVSERVKTEATTDGTVVASDTKHKTAAKDADDGDNDDPALTTGASTWKREIQLLHELEKVPVGQTNATIERLHGEILEIVAKYRLEKEEAAAKKKAEKKKQQQQEGKADSAAPDAASADPAKDAESGIVDTPRTGVDDINANVQNGGSTTISTPKKPALLYGAPGDVSKDTAAAAAAATTTATLANGSSRKKPATKSSDRNSAGHVNSSGGGSKKGSRAPSTVNEITLENLEKFKAVNAAKMSRSNSIQLQQQQQQDQGWSTGLNFEDEEDQLASSSSEDDDGDHPHHRRRLKITATTTSAPPRRRYNGGAGRSRLSQYDQQQQQQQQQGSQQYASDQDETGSQIDELESD